jgi:oligopeptide/dipeptide ABC transporter ATP-binding protein
VELASADQIMKNHCHPYTRKLFSSVPGKQMSIEEKENDEDERPASPAEKKPARPPAGCTYADACPIGDRKCRAGEPVLSEIAEGHGVACFKGEPLNLEP